MWVWRTGKLCGIDIKIHFTFPLVLLWGAFQWGYILNGGLQGAFFGAIVVLLLFLCVLLHELGHALAAQYYEIDVIDITLLPIGGVAQLRIMPDSPKQEFVIASAGPLVNLVIAMALLPPALILSFFGAHGASNFFFYLLIANLGLTIFNLIPAFPMDGGRILRAFLALLVGYRLATQLSVRLGQLVAVLFLGIGIFYNPPLILVALFVFVSASSELQRLAIRDILIRAPVGRFLADAGTRVGPAWPLQAARLVALQTGQQAFAVVDQGRVIGLVTASILDRVLWGVVREVMQTNFVVLRPGQTLYEAQNAMAARGHEVAVVVEGGVFLGLIRLEDVMAYTQHRIEAKPRLRFAH